MTRKDLIEKIAEIIYKNEGGIAAEDYMDVFGKSKLQWDTGGPWDTDSNALTEHERDDYRFQAEAVVLYLEAMSLIQKEN